MSLSLSGLFRKPDNREIGLYCQNKQCNNSLISKNEDYIANVDGALVHSTRECIGSYISQKLLNSKSDCMIFPSVLHLQYSEAEMLARKGKVKFSRLETESGEEK